MGQKKIIGDLDVVGTITQNGSPIGGGGGSSGISIDTSGLFTLAAPMIRGIAFNVIDPLDTSSPIFYPTLNFEDSPKAEIKCSMIIISNLGDITISGLTGDLYSYDNVQITASNIASYFGKLLILKSNVTIRGRFN